MVIHVHLLAHTTAWSYGIDGSLKDIPLEERAYPQGACKEQWGLVEVNRVKSYKGLVFGCWDETTPDLEEYMGDIAWYLDGVIDRRPGGTRNYWWRTQAGKLTVTGNLLQNSLLLTNTTLCSPRLCHSGTWVQNQMMTAANN